MNEIIIGIGLLAIAAFLAEIIYSMMRQKRCDELTDLLIKENYLKFNEVINLSSTKKVLSEYIILSFKVSKSIQQKNTKDLTYVIFEVTKSKAKNQQKGFLYQKSFFYFIAQQEYSKAGKLYQMMKELNGFTISDQVELFYNTFVENGYKYLEQMVETFEKEDYIPLKVEYAGVIAKMYKNKHDLDNQKLYLEIAKKLVEK